MKISKISVSNFKAIDFQEINLNGCSAIVTAGNNKGKTSLLRGLIDRFHSHKPSVIVKQGEELGSQVMELTDGSKIEWRFTEKSEAFSFTTKEGIRQTTGVISSIGERYFGKKFDIDKFISSTPKAQIKALQDLVGIDFTEIDERYKKAYEERTVANAEVKRLRSMALKEPKKVEKPDVKALRESLFKAREKNAKIVVENAKLKELMDAVNKVKGIAKQYSMEAYIDFKGIDKMVDKVESAIEEKVDTDKLEQEVFEATKLENAFNMYERDLKDYKNWLEDGKKATEKANKLDAKVKAIQDEKREMISNANMPADFEITEDEVMYKGLPLTDSQVSTSAKYIAALKLGALLLGEVKSLHFDASPLDNVSLKEIQEWAADNDLQLLIERPDIENGGEIQYEIIQNKQ